MPSLPLVVPLVAPAAPGDTVEVVIYDDHHTVTELGLPRGKIRFEAHLVEPTPGAERANPIHGVGA
eukprot:3601729-Lingulodinium_polyedra.AAC.1